MFFFPLLPLLYFYFFFVKNWTKGADVKLSLNHVIIVERLTRWKNQECVTSSGWSQHYMSILSTLKALISELVCKHYFSIRSCLWISSLDILCFWCPLLLLFRSLSEVIASSLCWNLIHLATSCDYWRVLSCILQWACWKTLQSVAMGWVSCGFEDLLQKIVNVRNITS